MKGTPKPGLCSALAAFVAAVSFLVAPTRADDLQTLSGQTFHAVRPVRVEPDGVTWEHAGGVVKVDFSDSPARVREAYHYDAARAAAYHDAQAEARRLSGERTQQVLQVNAERQRVHAQTVAGVQATAAAPADLLPGAPPTLVYRHGLSDTAQAAAHSLGEQMDARKAQAATDAQNSEGLGNPNFWRYVPGVGSKPKPQRVDLPNAAEYKASLHAGVNDDKKSVLESTFYNPLYMTKSYYEDVDRAAAFARGTP